MRRRPPAHAARLLGAALAAALVAGCGTRAVPSRAPAAPGPTPGTAAAAPAAAPAPVPAAPSTFADGAWTLASLAGRAVPSGAGATLRFDGERVSGSDGCNRFAGPWTGHGASLRIGPNLAATQRACPEPQRALAADFGRALAATSAWRLEGTTLVLLGEGGTPLAALEPQPTGLAGTAWQVVAYNTGRQAIAGVGSGPRPTIEFGTAGGLRGSTGCNTYSGSWTESTGRIAIGPLRVTRETCADPPDAMTREAAVLAALESAASARREGDRLELRTATGAIALSAVAMPPR